MQSLVVLLLFVGMLMLVHGLYEDRLRALEKKTRVEYRFIPRTYYDEQLAKSDLTALFGNMFDRSSPWEDRRFSIDVRAPTRLAPRPTSSSSTTRPSPQTSPPPPSASLTSPSTPSSATT